MRKLLCSVAAAALVGLFAGSASAQSAKFAATYDTDIVLAEITVDGSGGATSDSDANAEMDLGKMHVPQSKEVLIGVSGQVNLVTFTQAKGKNGAGVATSIATGTVELTVRYAPEGTVDICNVGAIAAPGPVVFASRAQTLSVDVDLDVTGIESITGDVTVALGLDTTAAHHFNFVAIDLDSDWYDIVACYDLTALAEVAGVDIDADTIASSKAAIGPRMLTMQQVRATTDGIVNESGSLD